MDIDSLLNQATTLGTKTMVLPEDWSQGRTAFGGVSAALLFAATQSQVTPNRALRALTTNFVGPLLSEQPFSIEVELLRQGGSASQFSSRIVQDGQVAVIQQSCFGEARPSHIRVANHNAHQLPAPQSLPVMPCVPGAPKFLQHMELAFASNSLPYSGSELSHIHGWMRFRQSPEVISDAHIICLIDAWPPTVLQMMKQPAPGSTMMWNLEFIHPHRPVNPSDWFAYMATTRQAADGYAHAEANIWDSAGELIALSRQSVAVFA